MSNEVIIGQNFPHTSIRYFLGHKPATKRVLFYCREIFPSKVFNRADIRAVSTGDNQTGKQRNPFISK